eukprot:Platyproteum_vivax@DN16032_c0_g1_i1.p1
MKHAIQFVGLFFLFVASLSEGGKAKLGRLGERLSLVSQHKNKNRDDPIELTIKAELEKQSKNIKDVVAFLLEDEGVEANNAAVVWPSSLLEREKAMKHVEDFIKSTKVGKEEKTAVQAESDARLKEGGIRLPLKIEFEPWESQSAELQQAVFEWKKERNASALHALEPLDKMPKDEADAIWNEFTLNPHNGLAEVAMRRGMKRKVAILDAQNASIREEAAKKATPQNTSTANVGDQRATKAASVDIRTHTPVAAAAA